MTDQGLLICRAPSGGRRSETRSSVFPSPAAQSGSRSGRIFPGTQSRSRARSLRSCAPHTPALEEYPRVAGADRAPGTARVRPFHPLSRSGAAPAAADPHHWPVPLPASAPARSDLLPPSPASARQFAETDARHSKTVIPLRTAPDTLLSTPSFSASVNSRFQSPVLPSWLLLSSREHGLSPVHERSVGE